jgi:membrane associated rhomboid family serine protease
MNQASVGFQCPECVREGGRGVRQARTAFGGATAGGEGTVTKVLVGINVAVFVLGLLLTAVEEGVGGAMRGLTGVGGPLHDLFAMVPLATSVDGGQVHFIGVVAGQWYRLVTAGFLHYGLLHLGLNMWALLLFGREAERMIGRWRFVVLYLLSGVGGSALAMLLASGPSVALAGASGSVFGLFGALVFFFRKLRLDPRQLIMLIVLNFGLGFFIASISWQAHLGGLLTGGLAGAVLAYAPAGKYRTAYQVAGLAVVATMVAVVAYFGYEKFVPILDGF